MAESKNKFLKLAQSQMGSAHLEVDSSRGLFKSFFGKLIQVFAMTRLPVGSKLRCSLERLRGVNIGKHVFMGGGNVLDRARPDLITIEDYVSLAGGVYILTHSNPTTPLREILGPASKKVAPVVIKRGAWIAVNVVILPGVTIGENSIVATGSVVMKDVPPMTIVGGAPAREIKKIIPVNQSA
ncbi:MAG: acyltransferase [Bacteroidia bacterium]|nr:acyltransferase [Bacteroidia bacterium]